MRVARSLPTAGVGLALLATLGFAGQSNLEKPTRAQKVRPESKIVVEPIEFSWGELVQIQASLNGMSASTEQSPFPMQPDQLIEVDTPEGFRVAPSADGAGREAMGSCPGFASEPPLDHGFVAQADVPDTGGFSYIPPNVAGSVGPNHVMTMMNNKVTIRDRIGGMVSTVDPAVFWGSPANLTAVAFPRLFYDLVNDRWLATARGQFSVAPTFRVMFAISDTDDPTGAWDLYTTPADPANLTFPDWLVMGYDTTWVVCAGNMFNIAGGAAAGSRLYTFDMAAALAGGPVTVTTFASNYWNVGTGTGAATSGFSVHPARNFDGSTVGSGGLWLLNNAFGAGATTLLQVGRVTGTGPAPVFTAVPSGTFAPGATSGLFPAVTNVSTTLRTMPQVGDARFITPFSIRTMSVAIRNGRLWSTNNVGLPGPHNNAAPTSGGFAWYEIDGTLAEAAALQPIAQSGQVTDGVNTVACYPSIAINCANDVVIGFSRGDATKNPECAYVVRLGTDPLNFMGPTRLLKTGDSSYWKNFGVGATAQWGLYSAASVDPVDDQTLWTVQEYAGMRVGPADNDSRWSTWWGRIGECGEPLVTDDPDSQTVCVGDPVSFSASATAFLAPLTYQWRKNGVDIAGATSSTLSIPVTIAGDAGTYDVRVIDGCGSVLSAPAVLDFAGAVVTSHPANQNVPKFGTATFTVAATGSGTLTYLWRKDGVPLVPAETNPTLIISPVTRPDIGFYDCIVSDVCGPTTSNAAVLSIPFESKNFGQESLELVIFKQPESAIVCEGTNHTLTVVAHGENLSYLWRKGGVAIVPPETNASLVLTNIDPSFNGSYDVIVTDNSGFLVSDSVVIDVDDLATITQQPTNVGAQNGDDVTFSVTAVGDGELTYQWQKGGLIGALNDMPGETGPTLELQNINNQDAGRYRCKVTNHCGTVFSNTAKLTLVQ